MDVVPDTEICNHALTLIGSGADDCRRLTNVVTDTGPTARWFRETWDSARRAAILRHDWSCCIDYLNGEDAGGDVEGVNHEPYDYAYRIPATFTDTTGTTHGVLACRGIVDVDDYKTPLKYGGPVNGIIHCDFTVDAFAWKLLLDRVSVWSPQLRTCLAYELAIMGATFLIPGDSGMERANFLHAKYIAPYTMGGILEVAKAQCVAEQHEEEDEPLWSEIT